MKKALVTLAILSASAAQASTNGSTTLYGQVGYNVTFGYNHHVPGEEVKPSVTATGDARNVIADAFNKASVNGKIGIKGEENLDNGVSAIFETAFAIDPDAGLNKTQKALLGFKGDFGQFTVGRQDDVWGTYLGKADGYFHNSLFENVNYDFDGTSVRYDAPAFVDGLSASAAYQFKDRTAELGLGYSVMGVDIGAALQWNISRNGQQVRVSSNKVGHFRAGLSAEYKYNNLFSVAADYQFQPKLANDDDLPANIKDWNKTRNYIGVAAKYNVTDDSNIYGGIQINANQLSYDRDSHNIAPHIAASVGYEYSVGHTTAWVEGGLSRVPGVAVEEKDGFYRAKNSDRVGVNDYSVQVGIRHKF